MSESDGPASLIEEEAVERDINKIEGLSRPLHDLLLSFERTYRDSGRELTLGDLGARQGMVGGISAVIVGNYLTTLGRSPDADLALLEELSMPVKALSATL